MKKLKLLVLFVAITSAILTSGVLHAQTNDQVRHLATLARLWGFLKYYHPDAAKGDPDWDKELIRMIPLTRRAPSDKAFHQLMADWYHSLPGAKLAAQPTQLKNDSTERIFDETDLRHFGIPKPLLNELTALYLYHLPDSSRYISDHYRQYHLDYIRHMEDESPIPAFPDEEHRLLALFRYWNIIAYFYPDKKINAPDWDQVLPDMIPAFAAAADTTGYRQAFLVLTAKLKDSHSFFYQQSWNKGHNQMNLPFQVAWIEGKFYISASPYDSLMKQGDYKIGDEIVQINGHPVADRVRELTPYTTGTNRSSFYRNIANSLFKIDTGRAMQLTLRRNGALLERSVSLFREQELKSFRKDPHPLWRDLGNGIYYVRFCEIAKADTLKKLFADLQNAKAVIWEMRDYPNFQVTKVAERGLFAEPPRSTINYHSILEFPGTLRKHIDPPAFTAVDSIRLSLYKGRMIVLVDERTQSLSESVAYELRFRPNTLIMGSQTAGTTGNITWVDFPGGISASYTGVGVKGLNDSFTEGKGVRIDKEIKLKAQDLLKYPDYMLEMAYQEALKGQ